VRHHRRLGGVAAELIDEAGQMRAHT
jgi:hypothetical protein